MSFQTLSLLISFSLISAEDFWANFHDLVFSKYSNFNFKLPFILERKNFLSRSQNNLGVIFLGPSKMLGSSKEHPHRNKCLYASSYFKINQRLDRV